MQVNHITWNHVRNCLLATTLVVSLLGSMPLLKADELSDVIQAADITISQKYTSELAAKRERKALEAIIDDNSLTDSQKIAAIKTVLRRFVKTTNTCY